MFLLPFSGFFLCLQARDVSVYHRLFHVRPLEDATQPVSAACQTARGLCVHAELDHGKNGADAPSVDCQPPHQRQVVISNVMNMFFKFWASRRSYGCLKSLKMFAFYLGVFKVWFCNEVLFTVENGHFYTPNKKTNTSCSNCLKSDYTFFVFA